MTTLARTRAESLFASITKRTDNTIESVATPPEHKAKPLKSGANTLHLPSGMQLADAGQPVTKSRRTQKPSGSTRAGRP